MDVHHPGGPDASRSISGRDRRPDRRHPHGPRGRRGLCAEAAAGWTVQGEHSLAGRHRRRGHRRVGRRRRSPLGRRVHVAAGRPGDGRRDRGRPPRDAGGMIPQPDGLLLVDKPTGITSHDAVDHVRRALGVRKVGHAGTLDPMATGLLLMGVGRATRLLRFVGDLPKEYEGAAVLGVETDTLDADGAVVREDPEAAAAVTEGAVRAAMGVLVGETEQTPPAYSAVKVQGERLYRSARRGEAREAPARTVRVDAFDLTSFSPLAFAFHVRCSGGTYVRSLVRDVGAALGCGAHLSQLRRTAIGRFRAQDGRPPDDPGLPLDPVAAVEHLPSVELNSDEALAASHGRILGPAGVEGPYRVHGPDGALVGIYHDDGPKAVPELILAVPVP